MGMFDNIKCKANLPVWGFSDATFQTKDTPSQLLDNYEIRENGELWHLDYDIVDKSNPNAKGIDRLVGIMSHENERWVFCDDFTGTINFYTFIIENKNKGWIEFQAFFKNGVLSGPITIFRIDR